MKRILLTLTLLLFLAVPVLAQDKISFIHDISVSTTRTNAVPIPDWAKWVGVMIPDLDAGAIGIEVYESGSGAYYDVAASALLASATTNWSPVLDISDGQDAVICASGSDPGYVDIIPFLGALRNVWIRFTVGTQTTADTTWYLYVKE